MRGVREGGGRKERGERREREIIKLETVSLVIKEGERISIR